MFWTISSKLAYHILFLADYAILSDTVVYSATATPAVTSAAFVLAELSNFAIECKAAER